mmetsp:Transcript_6745/g.12039  ORF Transcript_6745/g.12039 Transcript_6745/m.12039 type:complete len:174 (+) Transcript_6745:3725-4246(+)
MSLAFTPSFTPLPNLDYNWWQTESQLRVGNFKVVLEGKNSRQVLERLVGELSAELTLGIKVHLLTLEVKLEDTLMKVPIEFWYAGELSLEKYPYIKHSLAEGASASIHVISILDRSSLDSLKENSPKEPFVVVLTDLDKAQEADFFREELPEEEIFVEARQALIHLVGRLIKD